MRKENIRVVTICLTQRTQRAQSFYLPSVFHAGARVVANFVTTRVRREFIHPLPPLRGTLSEPDVKLGSLTLIRHNMTLSHFSKGLIRPVSGGESVTTEYHRASRLSP